MSFTHTAWVCVVHSTGDLKVISGDTKTFYKVNSEDYLKYVSDLSERLKEVQWY